MDGSLYMNKYHIEAILDYITVKVGNQCWLNYKKITSIACVVVK